jgi:tetratricopeptide (TPR) repeat protein
MSTGTQTSFEELIKSAEESFAQKDWEKTIETLNTARKQMPEETAPQESERIHYTLGFCFNELDKPSEANPHLKKALRLAEMHEHEHGQARAFEQLGSAAYKKNDHRASMTYFRAALVIYRKNEDKTGLARTLRDIGSLQSDLAQDSEAEHNFNEAKVYFKELEDLDGIMACVTNVGLLHYRKGGPGAAAAVYEKAFDEDQISHYLMLNNAGFLKLVTHDYGKAREFLTRAEEDLKVRGASDDNAALLYLNLAVVDTLEDRFDDALSHLDQAREYFDQYPDGRAVELVLCANKEERDKGFEPFLVVEDAHKDGVIALNRAAILARQSPDNLDQAFQEAQKGVEADRTLAYPYYGLGWLYLRKGDPQSATSNFKRAVGLDPNNEVLKSALQAVNPFIEQKVGRNEPCPCGSGKKFKKCHGKA